MNRLKRIRNNKGMTLVETVIAIFIISVSVLTIFGTLSAATNMMSRAVEYKKAVDEGLYLLTANQDTSDDGQTILEITESNKVIITLINGAETREVENVIMIKSKHSSGEITLTKLEIDLANYNLAIAPSTNPIRMGYEFNSDRE